MSLPSWAGTVCKLLHERLRRGARYLPGRCRPGVEDLDGALVACPEHELRVGRGGPCGCPFGQFSREACGGLAKWPRWARMAAEHDAAPEAVPATTVAGDGGAGGVHAPAAGRSRGAALLGLQRSAGNAAVVRLL